MSGEGQREEKESEADSVLSAKPNQESCAQQTEPSRRPYLFCFYGSDTTVVSSNPTTITWRHSYHEFKLRQC